MAKSKESTLEQDLVQLETIVKDLESGKLDLQKSLELFESGIGLYKNCRSKLGKIEKKVKVLTDELAEEDFEV